MSAEPEWRGSRGRTQQMHKPVSLFTLTAAVIVSAWCWLGSAVPMPPSPLDRGEKLYCISYAPFRGSQTPFGELNAQGPVIGSQRWPAVTDAR